MSLTSDTLDRQKTRVEKGEALGETPQQVGAQQLSPASQNCSHGRATANYSQTARDGSKRTSLEPSVKLRAASDALQAGPTLGSCLVRLASETGPRSVCVKGRACLSKRFTLSDEHSTAKQDARAGPTMTCESKRWLALLTSVVVGDQGSASIRTCSRVLSAVFGAAAA